MKKLFSKLLKVFEHLLWIFPLKNIVIFFTYDGKEIGDNLLPICNSLLEKKVRIYSVLAKGEEGKKNINYVRKYSVKYFYLMNVSKIVITNTGVPSVTAKRKNQVFINTWHGSGGLKGFGKGEINNSFNIFDYFIAESQVDEKWLISDKCFDFHNSILRCGMPRNDMLINNNENQVAYLKKKYGFEPTRKIILYAPTWRESKDFIFLSNFDKLIRCFKEKYDSDFYFLYKKHHLQTDVILDNMDNVIDCSQGYEIQELLAISDVLITDYSSCAWDFSLMRKPVFQYMVDYDSYIKARGNSLIDYSVLPFIKANSFEELIKNVTDFNIDAYRKELDRYFEYMKPYNFEGKSTQYIRDLCIRILAGENHV